MYNNNKNSNKHTDTIESINQYQILPETNQENKTTNYLYEYIVYSYNLSALSLSLLHTVMYMSAYMYVYVHFRLAAPTSPTPFPFCLYWQALTSTR